MELLSKLDLTEDFDTLVELFYLGSKNLGYRLTHQGKVLFEGTDFRPSPLHYQDSLETMVGLLGLLTLSPGGAEREFFDNYTEEQMEFAQSSVATDIQLFVHDFENDDEYNEDFHKEAASYLEEHYEIC